MTLDNTANDGKNFTLQTSTEIICMTFLSPCTTLFSKLTITANGNNDPTIYSALISVSIKLRRECLSLILLITGILYIFRYEGSHIERLFYSPSPKNIQNSK